jgi:molecular chaperone Hsp33
MVPGMIEAGTGTDLLLPFLIDARSIRGRIVRLGASLDSILAGHDYPNAVSLRLAEAMVMAVALAGSLKFDGVFTLQIQADGAIPLLVTDVTSEGDLRGYARFDAEKLAAADADKSGKGVVPRYLGKGFLAFTVDQGADTERYQGIVELTGDRLDECAREYFMQSEQLETCFKLAARGPDRGRKGWQAAVLMIQRMPLGPNSPILTAPEADENWNRARILLESATDGELLDTDLPVATLLHRLYHAEMLERHDARLLRARCRCSLGRVEGTLKSFPRAEVENFRDDRGDVVVTCEYCKSSYSFTDQDLDRLYAV